MRPPESEILKVPFPEIPLKRLLLMLASAFVLLLAVMVARTIRAPADGFVWGRGTLDDKTTVLASLEAV